MADYWILGDDGMAAYPCEAGLRVLDHDGETIDVLPKDWTKEQAEAWARGYSTGHRSGIDRGFEWGTANARNKVLEALDIKDDLVELQAGVRMLAQVLYYHDGVCKEDVAELAGRYDG